MNGKAFLKNILLLILVIISIFFIITKPGFTGIGTRPLFILISIPLNILLSEKRTKPNKFLKISNILLSIINISWFLYHIYELISAYIEWNYIELDITYIYTIILLTTFLTSLKDIKKETNTLNDFLTILTTTLLIIIHYRYYLDKNFLHNIVGNTNSYYTYITQYYIYFILMYIILFANKKINQIKDK